MNKIIPIIFFTLAAASAWGIELSLEEAERLAIKTSSEIKYAEQQLVIAAMKNNLDLRVFLPELSVNFSSGRQINTNAPDSNSWRLGFDLNQPVFDGGRTLKSRGLANIQLGLQAGELEQIVEEVRDKIWQLFYSLLLNKEKLKLQKELLELTAEQLIIASKKLELGKLTELDYIEASIETRNMELDILNTESSENSFLQDFAVMTGFDPWYFKNDTLILKGALDREYEGLPLWVKDSPCYTGKALIKNNSLQQALVELNQLKTAYDILKTSFIPRISLDSSFYVQGTKLPMQEPVISLSLVIDFPWSGVPSKMTAGSSTQADSQISASLSNKWELFPSLDFIVDEESAELKLHQASESLKIQKQSLERGIITAIEQLEHERLGITIRRNTQHLQEKRLRILEARSLMGEVKELDLLELRIEFYQEEIGIREAVLALMNNEREFEKLIGVEFGTLAELAESVYFRDFK